MEDNKIKQTQEMSIENTKMCAACSEDYKIPPSIISLPDTSYARDLQAQGACALRFFKYARIHDNFHFAIKSSHLRETRP